MLVKKREFTLPDVQIPTDVPIAVHSFADFFKGFDKLPIIKLLQTGAEDKYKERIRFKKSGL